MHLMCAVITSQSQDESLVSVREISVRPRGSAGFFNSNFGAVVVLRRESSDLSLAGTGEGRRGDYRCGRLRKDGQHLGLFFERVHVAFSSWPRFGNFDIVHRTPRKYWQK